MLLDGAFTALLLVSAVSAVTVAPPTNVTVSCQKLKVRVSWEYSKQHPQTRFRVHIKGSEWQNESITTDHHYDLTHFIWASEERYMDRYQVVLTAIQGNDQSEPVKSDTFSFNQLTTNVKTCELDFPPVDVDAKDSVATVSFRNPFHFYGELKRAAKRVTASFQFTVNSSGRDFSNSCIAEQKTCLCDVSFLALNKCVTLTGQLYKWNGVGEILFKKTDCININESSEIHMITLITLLSIAFLMISVAAFIIYKAKVWVRGSDEEWEPPGQLPTDVEPYTQPDPEFASVTLPDKMPSTNVSVSSEEENDPTENLQDSSAASDVRPHDDCYTDGGLLESSDQELESAGLLSNEHRSDDDSADDSVNTECVSMHFEGEEEESKYVSRSHYDCPHTLVDVSDDAH